MAAAGLGQLDLAAHLCVDPKTVERWLAGRVPHPQTRKALARLVESDVDVLWPSAGKPQHRRQIGGEVRAFYAHRWNVPRESWVQFFSRPENEIDILVYGGLFLAEDAGILKLLAGKAQSGVPIRLLAGDPDCAQVAQRGADEGIGDTTGARIRNALALLRPLTDLEGVTLRLHDTILYNSIFHADDELLVNPHIYGLPGSNAPVLHVRCAESATLFATYMDSFESVWASAIPA